MTYLKIDWELLEIIIDDLYKEIKKSYLPDYIISIGRGGLIPSRLLADKFSIQDISIFHVKLYNGVNSKNKIVYKQFNEIIENKIVLLVDDICDTGETVDKVVELLQNKRYGNLKTATLMCKDDSKIKPTFIGRNVQKEWIIFPWEKTEFKSI